MLAARWLHSSSMPYRTDLVATTAFRTSPSGLLTSLLPCHHRVPTPVARAQTANSGRVQPSRNCNTVRCAARTRARIPAGANYDYLPTSLAAAREELALLAAPGSEWPAEAHAVIQAADAALGGHWLMMTCGHFVEPHEQAGQPANALFQLVFVAVTEDKSGESPYRVGRDPVLVHVLKQPEDMPMPMVHVIAYELDSNGWPTGAVYNSATTFEKLTDRAHLKKFSGSCSIVYQGERCTRLLNYFNTQLKPRNISQPPRQLTRVVADWSRDQLAALGVTVPLVEDAVNYQRW